MTDLKADFLKDALVLSRSATRRVLVVDDDKDTAAMVAELLRQAGHAVQVAHDGVGALTEAAVMQPDVIILDIGMPGLDGYQVARRLRAGVGASALLIALTGFGEPRDRERARESGFDYHLVKPVDPEKLQSLLKN